jgi:hypothetical protein
MHGPWSQLVFAGFILGLGGCTLENGEPELPGGDAPFRLYDIAQGDTMGSIARSLQVAGGIPTLVELNRITNPDRIRTGDRLLVPLNPATVALPGYYRVTAPPPTLWTCHARQWSESGRAAPLAAGECDRSLCVQVNSATSVCRCQFDADREGMGVLVDGSLRHHWWIPSYFLGAVEFEVAAVETGSTNLYRD